MPAMALSALADAGVQCNVNLVVRLVSKVDALLVHQPSDRGAEAERENALEMKKDH